MRDNLKALRRQEGFTQDQLAAILGMTTRHYQLIESGASKSSVDVWETLRDLLHAPCIDYLLEQIVDTTRIAEG